MLPMCWKCANIKTMKNPLSTEGVVSRVMVGCKDDPQIGGYKDAEKLCPLLYRPTRKDG